jgi:hypothetical protein
LDAVHSWPVRAVTQSRRSRKPWATGLPAVGEADAPVVAPFVELFRNLVVNRGDKPRVPGELIPMTLPEGAGEG